MNPLLHTNHLMFGVDIHDICVPPMGPVTVPNSPHMVFAMLSWSGASQYAPTVGTLGGGAKPYNMYGMGGLFGGGTPIPHVTPPNLLLLVHNALSTSLADFGNSTIVHADKPSALGVIPFTMNINMNCAGFTGLPMRPTGVVPAPNTVYATMRIGDYLAGLFSCVMDVVVAKVFMLFGGLAVHAVSKVLGLLPKLLPAFARRMLATGALIGNINLTIMFRNAAAWTSRQLGKLRGLSNKISPKMTAAVEHFLSNAHKGAAEHFSHSAHAVSGAPKVYSKQYWAGMVGKGEGAGASHGAAGATSHASNAAGHGAHGAGHAHGAPDGVLKYSGYGVAHVTEHHKTHAWLHSPIASVQANIHHLLGEEHFDPHHGGGHADGHGAGGQQGGHGSGGHGSGAHAGGH